MSSRLLFRSIKELFSTKIPPGDSEDSNFSSEGKFIATTAVASVTIGLPIGSCEIITEQFAVPPRISGP